ncbi:hypothetical protein FD755_025043 [Muntiacus reevesi]|uniref:Uncharacterized protein n=1 Tax=Muntiacus reevesi TaxID=9886 RepID=A0A5N3UQY7_MUNRE|nr:hypothetical protein FD755_025044 [Muntiacus reevesi]KAB0339155.1 hypothetical protein FD755_025043 [Muntiacus reevesi]
MSQSPRPPVPSQPQPQKRKSTPLPSPRPLTREVQQTRKRPATEIPEEPTADPPTKQMSRLSIKDGAQPPTPSRRRRPPGRPARTTQQASIPTWGQIKSLCHQAQGIASLQGSSASPERVFIAMLALLSCQASATSSTSEKYWAYARDYR